MSFKNETPNWDDLRLFLSVADEGGLIGAATVTGVSSPTLSRRMRHLEDQLGVRLFERSQAGYEVTSHGRELLSRVREMAGQSQSIHAWLSHLDQRPVVRVTSGFWTSVFLAQNLREIAPAATDPRIELRSGAAFLNLSRREADIAVRNKRPEQPELTCKRIGQVRFAIYGAAAYVAAHPEAQSEARYDRCDWVVPSVAGGTGSSSFWLRQRIGDTAALTCDSPHAMLEAVGAAHGLCVLPCFIGARDPRLVPCSEPLGGIEHTQWLVRHSEDDGLPHVRKTYRQIARLFEKHRAAF
ncbi:MAG: LysR family transcriptional regulator [Thalassovita sp.]